MAVLKYRATDGMVKTLNIAQGGTTDAVVSVNGKTGVVTGLYDSDNPPPYPVTSVNGKTGAVTGLYESNNPPPYPVTSVNGKTGDVIVTPSLTKKVVVGENILFSGSYTNQSNFPISNFDGLTSENYETFFVSLIGLAHAGIIEGYYVSGDNLIVTHYDVLGATIETPAGDPKILFVY